MDVFIVKELKNTLYKVITTFKSRMERIIYLGQMRSASVVLEANDIILF